MGESRTEGVKPPRCPLRQVSVRVRTAVEISAGTAVLRRGRLDLRAARIIPTLLLWPWQERPRGALCSSVGNCIARTFSQPQLQRTPLILFYSALTLPCPEGVGSGEEGMGRREDFNFLCCLLHLPSMWSRKWALNLSGNSALKLACPPTHCYLQLHSWKKANGKLLCFLTCTRKLLTKIYWAWWRFYWFRKHPRSWQQSLQH